MRGRSTLAVLTLLLVSGPVRAQDAADGLTVPSPPPGSTVPGTPTAIPPVAPPSAPQGEVVPPPPNAAGAPSMLPIEVIVQPLLAAAEADLAAGRNALALARTTLVAESLAEGVPQRIRAEGYQLLARQRSSPGAQAPTLEEVLAPQVAQAELDVRARRPQVALARLDFALARLPGGTGLRRRAERLREIASRSLSLTAPRLPAHAGYGPPAPLFAPRPPSAPAPDPDRRGGAEAVELYVTAAAFGALTGAYVPFAASNATAGDSAYAIGVIAGGGLLAVGVLALDLSGSLRTGVGPTISSSIRFGFANGMLALGIATAEGVDDPLTYFTLVWSGTALGAAIGLGVGFGLQPRVHEERFVESVGIWGGVLGTAIALLTEYEDPGLGLGLSVGGLDLGILAGVVAVGAGIQLPVRRTLFLDVGFLGGTALGAGLVLAYYDLSSDAIEVAPIGAGMLIGGIGGWALLYALTDGMEMPDDETMPVSFGVGPAPGGATVNLSGSF